ncbi:hypothetical protein PR202_gb06602 [Eleusine coracana subsp. coracana]|uniref:non-specific serine/threonine protein kinase n=1 Tax=Eleusine coracana subsp. coracana TaxID=191504 RepID=A0AAV5EA23_ELECO|nr:hypothetical protein PR202_gb06602 [Eleusine coracana subsp. coracana]
MEKARAKKGMDLHGGGCTGSLERSILGIRVKRKLAQASFAAPNIADQLTLLLFKSRIRSDPSRALATWGNLSLPICQWHGVGCGLSGRRRGRVVALDLAELNLLGTITPALGNLTYLRQLHLSGNRFHGILPQELGNLHDLEKLQINYNSIVGVIPPLLSNCSHLIEISVYRNKIHGGIPSELFSLYNLESLFLGENFLTGSISSNIGRLVNLKKLVLQRNNMTGEIPTEIGSLANLNVLALGVNQFSGTIPTSLGNLSAMTILTITLNELEGSIPPLQTLSSLSVLELGANKLEGPIPSCATNGFAFENLVGTGSFGSVYKGRMRDNGQHVIIAVKGHDFKALVYEFLPNGNLDQWLHQNIIEDGEQKALHLMARLCVAIDVASSLDYLHKYKPVPIIHCDLKPSNVLLDSDMVAHISKLKWSFVIDYLISVYILEYGLGNEVSIHGDVYSYGILLLEMFTGNRPTDSEFEETIGLREYVLMALPDRVDVITDQQLLAEKEEGETGTSNSGSISRDVKIACITSILQVGICCSEETPMDRLPIGDALKELQAIRGKFLKHLSSEGAMEHHHQATEELKINNCSRDT